MKLVRKGAYSLPAEGIKCVATIGNFDGVHLGHQAIIRELQGWAKKTQLPSTVITFEPMPKEFFMREKAPKRLMQFREKFEALQQLGVEVMCVLRFNAAMAALLPEDFIRIILVEGLNIQRLVIGDDFRFGKDRKGDVTLLEQQGKIFGFSVTVMPMYLLNNQKVSSTRIREALAHGKIDEARNLLGRKV